MAEIGFQFCLLMKENCQIMEMRSQGTEPQRYAEASEETKRDQNYKLNRTYSLIFGITFIIILILGGFTL